MDRGAWWVAVRRGWKKSGMTVQLSMHARTQVLPGGGANQKSSLLISSPAIVLVGCAAVHRNMLFIVQ